MPFVTLLDIAKANGCDPLVGLIDETIQDFPELLMGAARTIKGGTYKTLVRKSRPTVSFRNANDGSDPVKGTYENRTVDTYILDPRWECDKAVADRYEDGAEAYIAMEAEGVMQAAWALLSQQMYYGTANDSKGFPGLINCYDSTNMVIDAGGTTASTGSSVWAVKFGPKNAQWVWGEGGLLELGDLRVGDITGQNGKKLKGYIQDLTAYPGFQVGNLKAVGRIKKLTEDSGKGLDDDKLADLLGLFPDSAKPDALFMTRRSRTQLQKSRTATTPTGAAVPLPRDYDDIPIYVTDAISNTEALTL